MMINPNDPRLLSIHLRRDLLKNGWDEAALAKALRDGVFTRVRHGAYADAGQFARLDEVAAHAVRARAAARQAKTAVVISHASALAFVDDAPMWGLDLSDVHLTRRDGKAGRREAGIRQHRGVLLDDDIVTIGDVEVMSALRAALEVMTYAPVEPALVVANHMLHNKVFTREELVERYDAGIDHWPGTSGANIVLRLADPRIESVGETRFDYLCFRQGLPRPVPQLEVYDERGTLLGRLDFAWPERKVWAEFDGRVKYEKLLREGESVTDVVLREKKRQELIERVTGWRCIRVDWEDLRHPERLAAKIRAAFAEMAA